MSPISLQKSPISLQKSPISLQKSPISLQQSRISLKKTLWASHDICMSWLAHKVSWLTQETHSARCRVARLSLTCVYVSHMCDTTHLWGDMTQSGKRYARCLATRVSRACDMTHMTSRPIQETNSTRCLSCDMSLSHAWHDSLILVHQIPRFVHYRLLERVEEGLVAFKIGCEGVAAAVTEKVYGCAN